MLNNCVCRIEGKGGSSVGFFCCIWSQACGHVYGLFTSNQFISKHYLKGHRYLRCVIADQVNYIPTNRYTFTCPILGVTFLEIMNCAKSVKRVDTNLSAVTYLTASRNDCIEICAIQFQPELHGAVTSRGRVSDNRGVHFAHSLNSKHRSSGAPICDMEGYVVGIQKAMRCANGVNYAVTMRYVCDAILSDRMRSDQLPFEQWRITKLALHGLVQSKKKPKNMVLEKNMLFEFHVASEGRPYWFCRSHYWYWSPHEPVGDGSEDDVIWMRVSPYDDMSITGGRLNGQEAPDECKSVIRFLQKEGHKYM